MQVPCSAYRILTLFVLALCRVAPVGVCSLVAARLAGMDDILGSMAKLGIYIVTVITGLVIHSFVVLPLIFFVATRKNPFTFMKGLREALMTAFGISSRFENFKSRSQHLNRSFILLMPNRTNLYNLSCGFKNKTTIVLKKRWQQFVTEFDRKTRKITLRLSYLLYSLIPFCI